MKTVTETITLQYPVEVDGVATDTLTIRRPKVRDIKMMDQHKGEIEKSIHFIAALCEIPPASVEELDADDFGKLSEKVGGFMPSVGRISNG